MTSRGDKTETVASTSAIIIHLEFELDGPLQKTVSRKSVDPPCTVGGDGS
jgi:hypothetical protein